jgi:uncharacterized membrane protein YkoI
MLKKLLIGGGIAGVLTVGVIIGSLTLVPVFAQTGNNDTVQGQATISASDAEAVALAANPGASIVENDLEKENGILVYSIELNNGIDVAVDASTGEILQTAADEQDNKNESEDQDSAENELGNSVQDQNEVDEHQPQYTGSIILDEAQYKGMSEADEAVALQDKATISAADAGQAALAANPGTTVVKTELDNENGVLVYSVELSNGLDVKVDAGNGKLLYTEQADDDAAGVAGDENTQETVED